jgi:hypothetical protein
VVLFGTPFGRPFGLLVTPFMAVNVCCFQNCNKALVCPLCLFAALYELLVVMFRRNSTLWQLSGLLKVSVS